MRRLTFPEIDKRRDTSAYRFVRGGCRCAARGVHGPNRRCLGTAARSTARWRNRRGGPLRRFPPRRGASSFTTTP